MATQTPKPASEKAEKQHDFYHLTSSSHFRVCLLLAPPSTLYLGVPSQKEGLTILTLFKIPILVFLTQQGYQVQGWASQLPMWN